MAGTKIALILGGAGNIGSAAATAFAKSEDYKQVVILSRSQEKIDKVIKSIGKEDENSAKKIIGVVGETGIEGGFLEVKQKVIAAVGDKLDSVVSASGFPWMHCGLMRDVSFEKMDSVFRSQFYAALGAYRSFIPMVEKSDSGAYVFVTGGGPDTFLGPGTGAMTIGGSCNQALARVVMKENREGSVCCAEMSFNLGVYPDPSYAQPGGFPYILSSEAGQGLFSVASKRVADASILVVKSSEDIKEIIANGKL